MLRSSFKSARTVINLSISILSTPVFKLAKSDFTARLNVPTPAASFNQLCCIIRWI